MPTEKKTVYTAFAPFNFKHNRKVFSAKEGEVFTPPEDFIEVPIDPNSPGIKFQFSTFMTTTVDDVGEKEMELPHYMVLPLSKG